MNTAPLVSVVIPCYNHEKYVKSTLDSILEDTYPNKEIVIINDGSKDASNNVIQSWIKDHKEEIRIEYLNRENRGLCATLNQLVKISNGKYVLLLASDDILINNTITKRVEILENNPTKLVLLSDASIINNQGKIIFESSIEFHNASKNNYNTVDGILYQTIVNLGISGATVLINRKIYDIVGFYPEDLSAEDWFFYQRAAAHGKILFWDQTVSYYRLHDSNTSNSLNYKIFGSIIISIKRNFKLFPNYKYKVLALRQAIRFSLIYIKIRIRSLFA
jgi:alpha-1,3-rhamnosyltransferase